ncbi:hypothetical protein [Leptolyngbya sp. FACHB-16]|uniref:hypothetical protein n=1 Tax=unclassified Leptolyngbya TaxID=2650499 RepID=UPI001688F68E|nr:hypothetical protein [Leptolyngbya sp. FACHB-16]MBD2156746.1 hypothetical protein [Leptolyngbya sp. FACHB-16]
MVEEAEYILDRDELLQIRQRKLLTSDRDYLYFALQIDYPGKLNPTINVESFCERWELSSGSFYKALGDLKNKGVVEAIFSELSLQMQVPEK